MLANLPSLTGLFASAQYFTEAVTATQSRVLLIGNYGDFGLTWWGPLSLLEQLRAGQWAGFARDLPATAAAADHSVARTFAGSVMLPIAPAGLRRLIYRLRGRDPDSVASFSALNPSFIVDAGLVQRWRQQGFDPWFGSYDSNPKRRRAHRLFDHNQYSRDIRGLADEIFGYEARDPHADRRLLEFALSVPEPLYHRRGIQRWFGRQVFADRLPRSIVGEHRRGANAPTWFRSLDARRVELAAEIERLEGSPLASRLIDLPRLKRLMSEWPKDDNEAEKRKREYRLALARGVHVGHFIRWVEGGNA